jgi:hypothetical protein
MQRQALEPCLSPTMKTQTPHLFHDLGSIKKKTLIPKSWLLQQPRTQNLLQGRSGYDNFDEEEDSVQRGRRPQRRPWRRGWRLMARMVGAVARQREGSRP